MKSWINAAILAVIILGLSLFYSSPKEASADWYSTGGTWTNRKSITIDHTKVEGSSNMTNFPVLVDITDSDLANYAQADGDDILFTSSDGTTKLDHEIEIYTSATGRLTAWVEVPTLDFDDNTVIYMYYGNSSASSQQNTTGVWSTNYKAVFHLPDAGSLTTNDSTSNNNDPELSGSPSSAGGKIYGAINFTPSQYASSSDSTSLDISGALTLSAWINADTLDGAVNENKGIIAKWRSQIGLTDQRAYLMGVMPDTDKVIAAVNPIGTSAGNKIITSTGTLTTGSWYHLAVTYVPSTSLNIYINGVLDTSDTTSIPASLYDSPTPLWLGLQFNSTNAAFYFDGSIDEARVISEALSGDWIKTEYNNQNATSTFYTIQNGETAPTINKVTVGGGTKVKGGVKFK